jgi:hypothetical protein
VTEVQERSQGLAKNATLESHLIMAQSIDFLKESARDFQGEFTTQLREAIDRAAAELSAETVRFSDRQLTHLTKQAQAAIGEGSAQLQSKAVEARAQLESVAGSMISDFHQKAGTEIDQAAVQVRQKFVSSLTSAAAEIRADFENRQRTWKEEIARASEQQAEQFRQKLESILQSSVVAAISSVNDHSTSLLKSFSKPAAESKDTAIKPVSR